MKKKNNIITLTQKDGHWGFIKGPEKHILLVWEIISYEKMVKLPTKPRPELIQCSYLDRRGNKFPFGLVDYIADKLIEEGYEVEIKEINKGLKPVKKPKLPGITFEDYQDKILKTAGTEKRGIIIAGTGSGKTVISAGIIAKYNFPITLFITIKKNIFTQTIKDFKKWFPNIDIGIVGDGECSVGHITVALYQSLSKWDLRKYNGILEMVIVDEVHEAGKSITKIVKQLNNVYHRYGLTATPQDLDESKEKSLEMYGNIGPIISEVTDSEVTSRVTGVDVYMINYFCLNPKGVTYKDCFKQDIMLSKIRNKKLLKAAKSLLLDKGKSCLFIVNQISQLKEVENIAKKMNLNPKVAHGKNKAEINDNVKELLNDKKINLVISTNVFSTGTNILTLDGVVLGSVRKSKINIIQIIGRARRKTEEKGNNNAIIIDCFDILKEDKYKKFYSYFKDYSLKRLELYKSKKWYRGKI